MPGLFISRDVVATSSRSQVSPRIEWSTDGGIARRTASGRGLVRLDGRSLDRVLEAIGSRVAPAVAASFQRRIVPIAQAAFDAWPVASGLSKSLLFLDVDASKDTLSAIFSNEADYSAEIHDGAVVEQWITRPIDEALPDIAEDIARDIANG